MQLEQISLLCNTMDSFENCRCETFKHKELDILGHAECVHIWISCLVQKPGFLTRKVIRQLNHINLATYYTQPNLTTALKFDKHVKLPLITIKRHYCIQCL